MKITDRSSIDEVELLIVVESHNSKPHLILNYGMHRIRRIELFHWGLIVDLFDSVSVDGEGPEGR